MKRRGLEEEEEGVTRRSFLKGAAAVGTAGFLGAATVGTVGSLIGPDEVLQGELLDTFVYVTPPGAILPQWFVEQGLSGQEARMNHFIPGRGASVLWKSVRTGEGSIRGGFPALLIQWDDAELEFPAGFARDEFVTQGLYAVFNCCTHLCCRPGWQLIPRSAYRDDLGRENVVCTCHWSQYNPRRLAEYQHPPPPTATGAKYVGIFRELSPAPRGMPLIPLQLDGDKIVGVAKNPSWYLYHDFKDRPVPEG